MKTEKLSCPVCGSKHVERIEQESVHELTLGNYFSFKEVFAKCKDCTEEIDISSETHQNFLLAQKTAEMAFVKKSIDSLASLGISMAFFERAFELPIRTLTRWKTGDFSATAVAFLRILITYPWIVEVAERRFDQFFSKQAVIMAAAKTFEQKITIHRNEQVEFTETANLNSFFTSSNTSIQCEG